MKESKGSTQLYTDIVQSQMKTAVAVLSITGCGFLSGIYIYHCQTSVLFYKTQLILPNISS